jgi:hypothetical protein
MSRRAMRRGLLSGMGRGRPRGDASGITLFKSIGKVSLGMTPARVRRALGRPSVINRFQGKITSYSYFGAHEFAISFDNVRAGDPADSILLNQGPYRTPQGIHLGSSRRQLKRAYLCALPLFVFMVTTATRSRRSIVQLILIPPLTPVQANDMSSSINPPAAGRSSRLHRRPSSHVRDACASKAGWVQAAPSTWLGSPISSPPIREMGSSDGESAIRGPLVTSPAGLYARQLVVQAPR